MSLNKIILQGNIGQDPKKIDFTNGGSIVKTSLATQESYKNKEGEWVNLDTDWHNLSFKFSQDRAMKIKKGDRVLVEGKLRYNKKDEKVYATVEVDSFKNFDQERSFDLGDPVQSTQPASVGQVDDDLPF